MQEKSKYKIYLDSTDRYIKKIRLVRLDDGVEKECYKTEGDFDIPSEIKKTLEKFSVNPYDCEIEANPGPGSFTGVKIGVTIANIFNWATGKKRIDNLQAPFYGREPNITLKKDL